MLDGFMEDPSGEGEEGEPAQIVLSASNFGAFPMANGLSRLRSGVRTVHLAEILASTDQRDESRDFVFGTAEVRP